MTVNLQHSTLRELWLLYRSLTFLDVDKPMLVGYIFRPKYAILHLEI